MTIQIPKSLIIYNEMGGRAKIENEKRAREEAERLAREEEEKNKAKFEKAFFLTDNEFGREVHNLVIAKYSDIEVIKMILLENDIEHFCTTNKN